MTRKGMSRKKHPPIPKNLPVKLEMERARKKVRKTGKLKSRAMPKAKGKRMEKAMAKPRVRVRVKPRVKAKARVPVQVKARVKAKGRVPVKRRMIPKARGRAKVRGKLKVRDKDKVRVRGREKARTPAEMDHRVRIQETPNPTNRPPAKVANQAKACPVESPVVKVKAKAVEKEKMVLAIPAVHPAAALRVDVEGRPRP